MLNAALLALRLMVATTTEVAEFECPDPGSDQHEMCFCTLETWRGNFQGWATNADGSRDPITLPNPDVVIAGCDY
jgi:hypothetical protein